MFFYKIFVSLSAEFQCFRPNFCERIPANIIEFDCLHARKQTKLSKAAPDASKF